MTSSYGNRAVENMGESIQQSGKIWANLSYVYTNLWPSIVIINKTKHGKIEPCAYIILCKLRCVNTEASQILNLPYGCSLCTIKTTWFIVPALYTIMQWISQPWYTIIISWNPHFIRFMGSQKKSSMAVFQEHRIPHWTSSHWKTIPLMISSFTIYIYDIR